MSSVAIIGYGIEGQGALKHFSRLGHDVTVCDQNQAIIVPEGTLTQLGPNYLHNLDRFDVVFRSSGIHPRIITEDNPNIGHKVTSVYNEFFAHCPTKNVIGVTGTKGKGTTSTLITKILQAAGKTVFLGGNIGISVLGFLEAIQPDDWVVLEASSFQLLDTNHSPDIAVCLTVTPEHLNWHADMDEYTNAKANLFAHQTSKGTAIFYAYNNLSAKIAARSPGKHIPYSAEPGAIVDESGNITIDGHTICAVKELKLLGKHNWQNACAAVTAAWQVTQNAQAIKSVLISFAGLPYRIEKRQTVKGITYYNDSFATGIPATIAAIKAIPGNKVVIIGGYDRMLDLSKLAPELLDQANGVRHVLLIGDSAGRLSKQLDEQGFFNYSICLDKTMDKIITAANKKAQKNDAVLLSPGFASFDLFKNFEDRGEKFNAAIEGL